MAFKSLFVFCLLHAATCTSVLNITSLLRRGNKVRLMCVEEHFNGQPPTELRNVSLFLFNATGQSVTSLLRDNGISYGFDSSSGILSFEVQQNIEGYYYCSRDMSAGLPHPSDYKTILGKFLIDQDDVHCLSSKPALHNVLANFWYSSGPIQVAKKNLHVVINCIHN